MSFSLYIHIPWCQSKCPYCDFNSHAASTWPEAEYTRGLIIEMTRRAHDSAWADDRVKTIFFGGGTPSLFEPLFRREILAHEGFHRTNSNGTRGDGGGRYWLAGQDAGSLEEERLTWD